MMLKEKPVGRTSAAAAAEAQRKRQASLESMDWPEEAPGSAAGDIAQLQLGAVEVLDGSISNGREEAAEPAAAARPKAEPVIVIVEDP